jgi:hypothetical protein
MKRYPILLLLCSMIVSTMAIARDSDDTEDTGRSYLGIRPMCQIASPEVLAQWRYSQTKWKEDGCDRAFQAVVFGSQTTNPQDLASYFTPFGIRRLNVDEDNNTAKAGPVDLFSSFFGVITSIDIPPSNPYSSILSICPEHSEVGIGFQYRHKLWENENQDSGLYFYASMPIMNVHNKLHLRETVLDDGGGRLQGPLTAATAATIDTSDVVATFDTMIEAFNQPDWCYGKITCDPNIMSKTGVADITAVLEYRWLEHDPCHIESYLGVLIPTGTTVTGKYLFEPVVGHGKHWGAVWGTNIGLRIWNSEEDDTKIRFELANNSMYLFAKTQMRSFDLNGRPWSRYIPVYQNLAAAEDAATLGGAAGTFSYTPGINVFTRPVNVTPGLSHTINTAFVFDWGKWQAELGYNFYARASELVKLCGFPTEVALVSLQGLGQTMPLQDIAAAVQDISSTDGAPLPLAQYDRAIIQESDLDLASAATPAILSNILYASAGVECEKRDYPVFANVGISYEFSDRTKAAPQRWGLWLKGGISF